MTNRIFRYVVRTDTGAAPNPCGGWCSLAICKPAIRRTAEVDDWIIGLQSRQNGRVIYVMQVEAKLTFAEYWKDSRFRSKQPDRCLSSDNIYRPNGVDLEWVPNAVHPKAAQGKDTGGIWVLVSKRFWYFGTASKPLPDSLQHLVHKSVGHTLQANRRPDDNIKLERWLDHWPSGIQGRPIDAERLRPLDPSAIHQRCRIGCVGRRPAKNLVLSTPSRC